MHHEHTSRCGRRGFACGGNDGCGSPTRARRYRCTSALLAALIATCAFGTVSVTLTSLQWQRAPRRVRIATPELGCAVAVRSLAPPTPLPPEFNCSVDAARAKIAELRGTPEWVTLERYRVVRFLLPAARAAAASRDAAAPPDIVLIDDDEWSDMFTCVDELKMNDWAAFVRFMPPFQAERARAIRAAVDAGPLGATFVVADTASLRDDHRAQLAHPRLVRLVVDIEAVPAADRGDPRRFVVVPYVTTLDAPPPPPPATLLRRGVGDGGAAPDAAVTAPAAPPSLVFFRGGCNVEPWASPGMRLRAHVVAALASVDGAVVGCGTPADRNASRAGAPPAAYLAQLRAATFCLVIAGDVPSTSRLPEVVAHGCVPAVLGPPWPTLPLLPAARYADFAVFLRLGDGGAAAWRAEGDDALLGDAGGPWAVEPRAAAFLAALAPPTVLDVPRATDIVRVLRGVPPARVAALRRAGAEHAREVFTASERPGSGGARAILGAVCASLSTLEKAP